MDIKAKFGVRLKELRLEKRYSQERLALKAGVDRTYIPSIEKGERNVSLQILQKLSGALEMTISELLEGLW